MSERVRITRFGLRHFKPFRFLDDLELRPLTVLCGANSSGKSSILQSLVLLKQSSQAGSFEGCLNFNGKYVNLHNFATIASDFDTTRPTEFRFTVEYSSDGVPTSGEIRIAIGLKDGAEHPSVREFEVTVKSGNESEAPSHLLVHDGIIVNSDTVVLRGPGFAGWTVPPDAKVIFEALWPAAIEAKPNDRARRMLFPFPVLNERVWFPIELLQDMLATRLAYLGPVRADPRAFYPVDMNPDIECRGEGTIPYLLRHAKDDTIYRLSPMGETQRGTLLEALNAWLGELQITKTLTIKAVEKIAFTAALHSPRIQSNSVDLAQVGFGISQILPVLTLGLTGPEDGMLLFEQPEIHLHPRLQAGLADFLLCSAQTGRTILLETHSDHLINRLRRRIAEDDTGELAKAVQILFVHSGTDDDPGSYVESLKIDEQGTIINAPRDFFPEAADDAHAVLQARRNRNKKVPV